MATIFSGLGLQSIIAQLKESYACKIPILGGYDKFALELVIRWIFETFFIKTNEYLIKHKYKTIN